MADNLLSAYGQSSSPDAKFLADVNGQTKLFPYKSIVSNGAARARQDYADELITKENLYAMIADNYDGLKMGMYMTPTIHLGAHTNGTTAVAAQDMTVTVKVIDAAPFLDEVHPQYAKIANPHVAAGVFLPSTYAHCWNPTNDTTGGVTSSQLQDFNDNILQPALENALGSDHMLAHQCLLSNAINASAVSGGYPGYTGCASNWAWANKKVVPFTLAQICGSSRAASSFFDIGEANFQFSAFKLKYWPAVVGDNIYFWTREVSSASHACLADANYGITRGHDAASIQSHVAALILLG